VGNGNFAAFLHLYDNELLEDEEEFSWEEEKDELDDEYDRIQSVSQERIRSLDDKIIDTELLLEKQVKEMDLAREVVMYLSYQGRKLCFSKEFFSHFCKF
jgi:hypothetical protein